MHTTAKSLNLKPLHFPDYNHHKTALKLPQGRSKINVVGRHVDFLFLKFQVDI